jgi:hypothetical protein
VLTVTLTWTLVNFLLSALSAELTLTPVVLLQDETYDLMIPAVPYSVTFTGGTGHLTGIIACDNPLLLPGAWAYVVTVTSPGGAVLLTLNPVFINYAYGAVQDLSALTGISQLPPRTFFPGPGTAGATLPGGLVSVPSQATSGPGWAWNSGSGTTFSGYTLPSGGIYVKAPGVTIENCYIGGSFGIYVNGAGDNVTVTNCVLVTPGGGNACIAFAAGAQYGTVENCTLSGTNGGAGRIVSGVVSNSGDPDFTLTGCDISWCKNAFENAQAYLTQGMINVTLAGNYVHDLGFVALDHTDCLYLSYGITGVISGNTFFNQLTESDVIGITGGNPGPLAITGNLLAGAGYTFYGGQPIAHATTSGPPYNTTFTGNWFSTQFYPGGGYYGPVTDWGTETNTWDGNYWFDGPSAGQTVTEPETTFAYPAAPSVPASGVPLVNPFGTTCAVTITAPAGCVITGITPASTQLLPPAGAAAQYMIPGQLMPAGTAVTLTYTGGPPTWTWVS